MLAIVVTAVIFAVVGLIVGCCLAAGAQSDDCAECSAWSRARCSTCYPPQNPH